LENFSSGKALRKKGKGEREIKHKGRQRTTRKMLEVLTSNDCPGGTRPLLINKILYKKHDTREAANHSETEDQGE